MPWNLFALAALSACGSHEPADTNACTDQAFWTDGDGDGFGSRSAATLACETPSGMVDNGDDCDDDVASIHPGATEACDGVDQDCDGVVDPASTAWFADADHDGFGDLAVSESACDAPKGFVADGTDCDDADGAVHPGQTEVCNGADDDCDGADDDGFDADGDGHTSLDCPLGDDCDDGEPTVHVGSKEICGDGLDNDCAAGDAICGFAGDIELADADAMVHAVTSQQDFGRLLDVGDVDGDGQPDLVGGALNADRHGAAYVIYGPISGDRPTDENGWILQGSAGMSGVGRSIGIGDVNDDGYDDVAAGAPYSKDFFVVFGPVDADVDLVDADIAMSSSSSFFAHGSDLGDVTGDGIDDVIVGAFSNGTGGLNAGAVYVKYGPVGAGADSIEDDHDAFLYGDAAWYTGRVVRGGADMNGDGVGDLIIQATGYAPAAGLEYTGAALVVYGPASGTLDLDGGADATLVGEGPADFASYVVAQGDVDGDGLADAIVGAISADVSGVIGGAAYVVSGLTTGELDLGSADVIVRGTASEEYLGSGVSAGDTDHDGFAELLVGAPYDATNGYEAGAAFLFYHPSPGTYEDVDADAIFLGEEEWDQAGTSVGLLDLDGDMDADVLVGAPGEGSSASAAGAIYALWSK